ncbi:MAG: NYN domain-containing protein [Panacagrimonas sp.]
MSTNPNTARLAVLIDADNTTKLAPMTGPLFAEIAKYGVASVKRIYGDWTQPNLGGWKKVLAEHAIQPMQQFANTSGKNATDSAMIIDAMDLLYTNRFDGFCIVSSDSDFTRLAVRIREAGLTAYGLGEEKTPKPFVSACDKFIYTELLVPPEEAAESSAPKQKSAKELRTDTSLLSLIRNGIKAASDDDGWAHLGPVGSHIAKQAPDFDSRTWGYGKLRDLVVAIGLFDVEKRKRPDGQSSGVYVREKPKGGARENAKGSV